MTTRELRRRARRMRRQTRREWGRLSPNQRTAIVAGAVVQLTLLAAAQIDISRRTDDEIRGNRLLWRLLVLINFIGPLLYFAVGRKKRIPLSGEEGEQPIPVVA